jgi:uncharacterized protein (DUF58 family)
MWRRRLGYLALVLAALALYLFENNAGTRMLLVVLAALPVLSALALVAVRPALTAALTLPAAPSRGETCAGQLTLHNAARLTLPCVRCTVRLRNLVTGETSSLTLAASVGARRDAVLNFTFCAAHYGALTAQVESLALCDCLGLFARKIPCTAQAETSIAPTRHRVSVQLADTPDFLLDSERYSADRPGGDPSETFRIRDYAPGDPIRQIHWKLTEKTGKTLVRDFGLPVVRDLLLLLETSALPGAALTPDDHDLQLELLLSLSQALAAQEIAHTVGWQDGTAARTPRWTLRRRATCPRSNRVCCTTPFGRATRPSSGASARRRSNALTRTRPCSRRIPRPIWRRSATATASRFCCRRRHPKKRAFSAPSGRRTTCGAII